MPTTGQIVAHEVIEFSHGGSEGITADVLLFAAFGNVDFRTDPNTGIARVILGFPVNDEVGATIGPFTYNPGEIPAFNIPPDSVVTEIRVRASIIPINIVGSATSFTPTITISDPENSSNSVTLNSPEFFQGPIPPNNGTPGDLSSHGDQIDFDFTFTPGNTTNWSILNNTTEGNVFDLLRKNQAIVRLNLTLEDPFLANTTNGETINIIGTTQTPSLELSYEPAPKAKIIIAGGTKVKIQPIQPTILENFKPAIHASGTSGLSFLANQQGAASDLNDIIFFYTENVPYGNVNYGPFDVDDFISLDYTGVHSIPTDATNISITTRVPCSQLSFGSEPDYQLLFSFTGTNDLGQTVAINKLSSIFPESSLPGVITNTFTSPNFTPNFINTLTTWDIYRNTTLTDEDGNSISDQTDGNLQIGAAGDPNDARPMIQISYVTTSNHKIILKGF